MVLNTAEYVPFNQLTSIERTFIMHAFGKHLNESGGTAPLELIANMYKEDPEIGLKEMEEWLFEGKREHYRKPFFTVVDFTTRGHAFKDFIKNISPGGVFIETSIPFSVGQELSLTFALPNCQKHIKITGEVVRITPQGIGVKFGMLKQQQETTNREKLDERRKHERFRPQLSAFALLNKPFSNMGEIIDISMSNLKKEYKTVDSVVYTIQQAMGVGMDFLCNPNSSRKHVGNRFEELIRLIVTELGVKNDKVVF